MICKISAKGQQIKIKNTFFYYTNIFIRKCNRQSLQI